MSYQFPYPKCQACQHPCVVSRGGTAHGRLSEPIGCYSQSTPLTGPIDDIIDGFSQRQRFASRKFHLTPPSEQSLRNLVGGWFEFLIAREAWNAAAAFNTLRRQSRRKIAVVKLPTAATIQFWKLYDEDAQTKLNEGLFRTLKENGIQMTMSNPDLVCIAGVPEDLIQLVSRRIVRLSLDDMHTLDSAYERFVGRCPYQSLRFGVAAKKGLRPDRRYQNVYEGSLMKAVVSHLHSRYWDSSFSARYYGVVNDTLSNEDKIVLSNPSIDSVISVYVQPRRAVDEIVQCDTLARVRKIFGRWIEDAVALMAHSPRPPDTVQKASLSRRRIRC